MSKPTKKKCKHTGAVHTWRDGHAGPIASRCSTVFGCGAWLPLGPSNDDSSNVQVEMRAAELVAMRALEPGRFARESSADEALGFEAASERCAPRLGEESGWLAFEIETCEQREQRDADAWPWDSTRSVAGQYEEHLVRAAVTLDPVPDPNALAAVAIVEIDELPRERACTMPGLAAVTMTVTGYDPRLGPGHPDNRDPTLEQDPVREPKHCDDYIDDESAPAVLRAYLTRARSPGHGMLTGDPFPRLFADYDGKRVRVVMASRLGDVGITADLQADITYQKRVAVEDLSNFGDTPDPSRDRLTAEEAAECATSSDSDVCQACGDKWAVHGQTCSGSSSAPNRKHSDG